MPSPTSKRFLIITTSIFAVALAAVAINASWLSGFQEKGVVATQSRLMDTPLNAITSFDGTVVARHIAAYHTFANVNQFCSADTTGNGAISANDVAKIAQFVVGLDPLPLPNLTDTIASPPCHANYQTTIPILKGDVSGEDPVSTGGVPGTVAVSLPVINATSGTVEVPITIDDTTSLDIESYDLQISFDPAVIQPAATPFVQTGTRSSAMYMTVNASNPGHLVISALNATPLSGSGVLLYLNFDIVGTAGQSTALTFEDYTDSNPRAHQSFLFNEGTPSAATTGGSVTILAPGAPSISGVVSYANAASPPKFIPAATVCANGTPTVCTTTNSSGQYTLGGMGSGPYTVSVTKTAQTNHISSNDCARIAQDVAGIAPLASTAKIAADVTYNGVVSSNDAAKVAFVTVGLTPQPPNFTSSWRFFVPNPTFPVGSSPTTYSYSEITSEITGQDFSGVLEGEVTGNWDPAAGRPVSGHGRPVVVGLPDLVANSSGDIVVPVQVRGAANKGIVAYEFDLRYDPSVIQPVAAGADALGTSSRGLSIVTNPFVSGLLRVVAYGAMPITEDGVLLNLRFTAVGKSGAVSPLTFERMVFNDSDSMPSASNGQIKLSNAVSN